VKQRIVLSTLVLASVMLAACSSSDDDSVVEQPPSEQLPVTGETPETGVPPAAEGEALFQIQITNLTNGQPFSPVALMLHQSGFNSFIDGETASVALELLAEGGNNADVLSEAQAATQHIDSGSTAGPIPPSTTSDSVSLAVPADSLNDVRLSVISMLVRTNDAFTGVNAANISGMEIGDTRVMNGPTWDSGTEANSELASTIPGPGFDGEGFNAARDDRIDLVRFHGGVVTNESAEFGLATSDLREVDRFLNPTSRISVVRVQ